MHKKQRYRYNRGYYMLPVCVNGLPISIRVGEIELLLKSEFHITLLSLKNLPKGGVDFVNEIEKFFYAFTDKYPIELDSISDDIRLVTKDDKVSVVIMCIVKNIKSFFESLNNHFHVSVPEQPTHITLYTLDGESGIALHNEHDVQNYTTAVHPEIAAAIFQKISVS